MRSIACLLLLYFNGVHIYCQVFGVGDGLVVVLFCVKKLAAMTNIQKTFYHMLATQVTHCSFFNLFKDNNGTEKECRYTFFLV
jgi:hypothetical protein